LLREYLDANQQGEFGRHSIIIDGIEGTEKYSTSVQRAVYDTLYIGDVFALLAAISRAYDLALLVDILEHFHCDNGMKLLHALRKKSPRSSSPLPGISAIHASGKTIPLKTTGINGNARILLLFLTGPSSIITIHS